MTAVAHATAANTGGTSTPVSPPTTAGNPLANQETFLKLLVSQLKNQDPLNPPDTSQFVSQLTAFSQLEQLIGIRQNTTADMSGMDAGTTAKDGATASTTKLHKAV